jgi:PKD repeat protein
MRAQFSLFSLVYLSRIRLAYLCVTMASLLASGWMQSEVRAAQVTFRWDYSASGAAGFVLYCGSSSGNYPMRVDVGNTDTYTIGTLAEGATSFCAVTAYDPAKVESDYSKELSVYIPAAVPVVDFGASPASGTAPLNVVFTNSTTGLVTSWAWDFGDGTTSTAQNPTHVYSTPGSYKAVLTATGPGGAASKTAATAISVVAPAAPVVNFSASPTGGAAPLSVIFTNTTTGQVTSWAWSFGDGTSSIVKSPTHVYSTPGSYKATLTATGPGGVASKTAATAITVSAGGTADGTAPTVGITAPSGGATVAGTTPVSAVASDNVGVVGVQFLLDGVALGAEQPGPSFSLPWSTNAVSNGAHTLSARARDAAGNTALAPGVSVTVSNTQALGLVAAYGFSEGGGSAVADGSGNGNNGMLTSGVSWTSQGKFGNALVFNGSNGRVDVADAPNLRLTTAMTLEAWVNPATESGSWRDVVYKGNDNYYLVASSGQGGVPAGRVGVSRVYGTSLLPTNTWTHLAVTYDKTTLRLYINGVQASSVAYAGDIATSANPLQIGGDSIYGQYFQGLIDEVRVYNRALSRSEIQADMNKAVAPAELDTTPPSAPPGLTATAVSSVQIDLAWGASTDNVGVLGYRIERCQGAGCTSFTYQVATPSGTTFSDTGLAAGTSYRYRVLATDGAGNLGSYSSIASATTLAVADTTPPSAPTGLTAKAASATRIDLAWNASVDNVAVKGYRVERCQGTTCTNFAEIASVTGTSFGNTGLASNTGYRFRVRAADAQGNLSAYSSVVSGATTSAAPVTGLVAAYSFSEGGGSTVADVSGNGNNGTLTSGADWTTQGKFGNALVFNGSSGRVDIPDTPSLRLSTAMTLEAWVSPTTASGRWCDIVYKGNDNYYLTASSNRSGIPAGRVGVRRLYGTSPLAANTWTHLAVTYDKATLRLYVNGVEASSVAYTGDIVTSANPLQIGGDGIYGQYFQGLIDEVRVYNRALNPSEIQADMNTAVSP